MRGNWTTWFLYRALVVLFIAGAAWFAREQLLKEDPRDRRVAQRVRLLDAPKPPPPKIEEQPSEVRQEREVEVTQEVPRESPGAKVPGDRLGLDEDGSGGADAFGLEARRGGRDITTIGSDVTTIGSDNPSGAGASGGALSWGWYGAILKRHVEEIMRNQKRLQGQSFQVVVHIWLAADGRVTRFDLIGTSGSGELDRTLREVLAEAPPLREQPPQNMPQPIRLRVTSRSSG